MRSENHTPRLGLVSLTEERVWCTDEAYPSALVED
jgi:hypothetical protein